MIGLEDWGSVASIHWIDVVLLCGWIIIHVVKPSVPTGGDLLHLGWEELAGIGVLDPSSLIVAEMSEVLVVSVSELVSANKWNNFIRETSLLVSRLVDFTSEYSSHKTLLSVKFPELRSEHTNVYTPRSHFF